MKTIIFLCVFILIIFLAYHFYLNNIFSKLINEIKKNKIDKFVDLSGGNNPNVLRPPKCFNKDNSTPEYGVLCWENGKSPSGGKIMSELRY
jgi:hypothetical protein